MIRGTLHLVVGPSGVGKDTLIDAARAARPDIHFPVRVITRPEGAGGEAHAAMTPEAFDRAEAAGAFLLAWRAHALAYGIPASVEAALAEGRHVVVNASRSVVAEARARLAPLRVLVVTAPPAVLAARLRARGRETEADQAARLDRAALGAPAGPDVTVIDNGVPVAEAAAAFLKALAPLRSGADA